MPPSNRRHENNEPSEGDGGPSGRLKQAVGGLAGALSERALSSVRGQVESAVGRLTDYAQGDGGPGLLAAVTGAKGGAGDQSPDRPKLSAGLTDVKDKASSVFRPGGGKSGGRQKLKFTNIVESIDVGVPVRLAYDQWTSYPQWPSFTKKVENAEPGDEGKTVNWKAQVFWSHREWQATITDQRPDERIIWRSKGQKGHVDGAVTFHELGPRLTKIVVVLEYHPQGFFERTGNLWRAQGRRVRLELKHFQRHVMAHALLEPDDIEGWRGTIEDGEVVKDHETALDEEDRDRDEEAEGTDEEAEGTDEEAEGTDAIATDDTDDDADGPADEPVAETAGAGRRRRR